MASIELYKMKDGSRFISGDREYIKVGNISGLGLNHADSQFVLDIEKNKIMVHKSWSKGILTEEPSCGYIEIADPSFLRPKKGCVIKLNLGSGCLEIHNSTGLLKIL